MMRVVAFVCAVALSGCALTTIKGHDKRQPATERPTCTTSWRNAQLDIGIGGFGGGLLMVTGGLYRDDDVGNDDETGNTLLLVGAAMFVAFYASGTIGYFRAKGCRDAVAAWERVNFTQPQYPQQPGPTYPGQTYPGQQPQPPPPQPPPPQPYPPPQ